MLMLFYEFPNLNSPLCNIALLESLEKEDTLALQRSLTVIIIMMISANHNSGSQPSIETADTTSLYV